MYICKTKISHTLVSKYWRTDFNNPHLCVIKDNPIVRKIGLLNMRFLNTDSISFFENITYNKTNRYENN